jgi:hypothetical protein
MVWNRAWNKSLDWTAFSDPLSGFDLVTNMVYQAFAPDTYLEREQFVAVALTTGTPFGSGAGIEGAAKYIFKARILSDHSPHMFLPDPCLLSEAGNTAAAINAIHQHTTFFGTINLTGDSSAPQIINPGDIVSVELERGFFSYNLEQGIFLELMRSAPTSAAGKACGSIAAAFGGLMPGPFGTAAAGATFNCKEDPCPPRDDPTFAKCKPPTYPNLPKRATNFSKYSADQVISAIKASGQSASIQKIMWAIIEKEQPKFSFPANNVAGIQLDGKRGFAGVTAASYDFQTCFRDGGGDQRIFAGFDTLDRGMKVFGKIIAGKMRVFKNLPGSSTNGDADVMTWNYYRSWNMALSSEELVSLKATGSVTRGDRTYEKNWGATRNSFQKSFTKWQSA